jgi:hypothetical protein
MVLLIPLVLYLTFDELAYYIDVCRPLVQPFERPNHAGLTAIAWSLCKAR